MDPLTDEADSGHRMDLWLALCKTPPSWLKKLGLPGKQSAIDTYSRIERLTQVLGPVGAGWGLDMPRGVILQGETWIASGDAWWSPDGGSTKKRSAVVGTAAHMIGRKIDHEAPKKALTDALTKGFSFAGLCADVFLGRHEDSKYVASLVGLERADKERELATGLATDDAEAVRRFETLAAPREATHDAAKALNPAAKANGGQVEAGDPTQKALLAEGLDPGLVAMLFQDVPAVQDVGRKLFQAACKHAGRGYAMSSFRTAGHEDMSTPPSSACVRRLALVFHAAGVKIEPTTTPAKS